MSSRNALAQPLAVPVLAALAIGQGFHGDVDFEPADPGGIGGSPTTSVPASPTPFDREDASDLRARYEILDDVEAPFVNLNLPAVRPIVQTDDGLHTFACNVHDSTVLHVDGETAPGQLLTESHRTPWGPVALALFTNANAELELLVACRGHHVLAILEPFSGDVLGVVPLEFEPADVLVIQETARAYVACSGSDSVVEVDLDARVVSQRFELPSKHPMFLSRFGDRVLVAPMISGNNSSTIPLGRIEVQGIVDLLDTDLVSVPLPDEDLFALDPSDGSVEALATGVGSVLFAHGENPATNAYWMLNQEHLNKDPDRQTEPAVRATFATNRLTILPSLPQPDTGTMFIDLDDSDPVMPGVQIDTTRTVAQPWSLDFTDTGFALVTGMGTDNVVVLDSTGAQVLEIDLPAGAIPRGAVWDSTETLALVHAWGRNELYVYSIVPFSATPIRTFDLGHDPTPELEREGRAIAYTASNSRDNNLSCFTCHVDGANDGLVWNLSGPPEDSKQPMFTQTLRGIDKMNPYHWRGERADLVDFNVAFDGLLGGAELSTGPGSDFEKFQAFVFSIQNTANRDADPSRVVSANVLTDAPNGLRANAVRGQRTYFDRPAIGSASCQDCHSQPLGTNNEMINTSAGNRGPHQPFLKVAPFHELWRKQMGKATFVWADGTEREVALLGAGVSHAGDVDDLFDFINIFGFSQQEKADVWSFVRQWDAGLAPMIHRAIHLTPENVQADVAHFTQYLLPQALRRNGDLVAFGTTEIGGVERELAWAFDRETRRFVCEDSTVAPRSPEFFLAETRAGHARNVVMGLPIGSGLRFAIDHDEDRAFNIDEATAGTDPLDPDTDDDGFPDGHELLHGSDPTSDASTPVDVTAAEVSRFRVQWVTTRVARVSFETSEPTTFVLDYSTPAGGSSRVSSDTLATTHNVLLRDLLGSTGTLVQHVYNGLLTVTDAAANETEAPLPSFTTRSQIQIDGPIFPVKIGGLTWTVLNAPGTDLQARAQARVDFVGGGPPAIPARNYVVVARVLVNGELSTDWTTTVPTSFTVRGEPYDEQFGAVEGPFVISSVSDENGLANLAFLQPNLQPGDEVVLNIEYVVPTGPDYDPDEPDFDVPGTVAPLAWFNFPETPKELRKLVTTF